MDGFGKATEMTAEDIRSLIQEKEKIENNISNAGRVLREHNIGLQDPLTDSNDYPRQDIPVYEVTEARSKVIHLLNDLKNVTHQIEDALAKYHSQDLPEFQDRSGRPPQIASKRYRHLAKITSIRPGSPAEHAGLKEDDIIIEFGRVNGDNFNSLQDISSVVKSSVDMYLKVIVERQGNLARVNLKPRKWEGQGLLGCNVVPA